MLLEFAILIIALGIGYAFLINRIKGLPPGPPPLPIVGNMIALAEPMDQVLLKWSKVYGPVFTVWMPGPTVVITGHQTLHESIVKQGDIYADRSLPMTQLEMLTQGAYGLALNANHMWREQRRFALHSLKDIGFLSASLQDNAKTYAQQIVAHWKEEGKEGKPIDVTENVMNGVANIIWQLTFGRTLPFRDPLFVEVEEVFHKLFTDMVHPCVTLLDTLPRIDLLDPLFGHPIRSLKTSSKRSLELLERELAITEQTLIVDEEPRCYADSFFIEMKRREERGEPLGNFTRHQLRVAAFDMWSAGFETTVTTIRLAVHFFMSYPEAQRKMQAEIDRVIGQRQVSTEDQRALPYCMAAIQEVQRCHSITEINFFRETNHATVVAGHRIPAGTRVLPQFASVHVDPDQFERPDYFCPDRHINAAGEFVRDPRIMPFSLGKRACLGEGLARMELFIFLVTFVQHCSFSSPTVVPPALKTNRGVTRSPVPFTVKITARF